MHYKDGTEAKVGDIVLGTTYNRKGTHVAVMVDVRPDSGKSCNCTVSTLVTVLENDDGKKVVIQAEGTDYSQCDNFTKII